MDLEVSDGSCTANPDYDGNAVTELLTGTDSLAIGETCTIVLSATVKVKAGTEAVFENSAEAGAVSPAGSLVSDASQDGLNNDPNNRGVGVSSTPTRFELDVPKPVARPQLERTAPEPLPGGFNERPSGPQAFTEDRNSGPLAYTGANSGLLATLGALLVLTGGLFVFASGRRRRNDEDGVDLEWETLDD
jgi:hypothetical protein